LNLPTDTFVGNAEFIYRYRSVGNNM